MNVAQARVEGHSSVCCFASSLGGHEGHVMFFPSMELLGWGFTVCAVLNWFPVHVWELREDEADL